MNKKGFYALLLVLSIAACLFMYKTGKNNRKLTELRQFAWVPAPLAILAAFGLANAYQKEQQEANKKQS